MPVCFTVRGQPPKKRQDISMWNNHVEAPRVVRLRERAAQAREEAGIAHCFRCHVSLTLVVYLPAPQIEQVGDLDNFVSGVCDALQAAPSNVPLHPAFDGQAVDPRTPLLLEDDAKVVCIAARKVRVEDTACEHYTVEVRPAVADGPARGTEE